jgi:prepilin-type N-terminal cleavage/methylation domain-containing protein
MKNLYNQKRQEGFTIIEVLIVLAIAAVILLIVFLAVPALQRNSRNNGIRNDAASVLAGANDFISNNNGQLPTGATVTGSTVSITGVAGTTATEAKIRGGTALTLQAGCPAVPAATGTIAVGTGCKCNQNGNGNQVSARAISAVFQTEVTSAATGIAAQCIES